VEDRWQQFEGVVMRPSEWKARMEAAAPGWERMRQQQEAAAVKRRDKLEELWAGIEVGDVVRLSSKLTREIYGLSLCNSQGEMIELDGEVKEIDGEWALIWVARAMGKRGRDGSEMIGVMQRVHRDKIVRVSDQPLTVWRDAADAMKAAANRDGKKKDASQWWE